MFRFTRHAASGVRMFVFPLRAGMREESAELSSNLSQIGGKVVGPSPWRSWAVPLRTYCRKVPNRQTASKPTSPSATTARHAVAGRGRGRPVSHDALTLLDLTARVAEAAEATRRTRSARKVSMPVFNRVKLDVDAARGLADPSRHPLRTPTAEAIQMRFREVAERPVKWEEVLDGALRSPHERAMWLSAMVREVRRSDLTDEIVVHALRLVAARLDVETLAQRDYDAGRERLVTEDRELYGEDGLLESLLPTGNQIFQHCGRVWEQAAELAGLLALGTLRQDPDDGRSSKRRGLAPAEVIALYGALNGAWPSRHNLFRFSSLCGFKMEEPPKSILSVREEAAALLRAEGLEPPTRTSGSAGRARRLTMRYPLDGVAGAPRARDAAARDPRRPPLLERQRILSLRVFLAGLTATARRTQSAYDRWQRGTRWTNKSRLIEHGGYSLHKRLAQEENDQARACGKDPLREALNEAEKVFAELDGLHGRTDGGAIPPFGEMLRAALASPQGEALGALQNGGRSARSSGNISGARS